MDQNNRQNLFSLIRSEVCADEKVDIKSPFSDDYLEELYQIANAHDVTHIVSAALYKHGILGENEISKKFKNKQVVSIFRCEKLKHAFREICSTLEKQEISYIPLKGSVIRGLYPEEWMRTSCDIDILVHEDDIDRAIDSLVDVLGYKTDKIINYHDVSLYSENGVHLELHFNIKENMDNIDKLLSKVWEHSYEDENVRFRHHQTNEYFVFHHIAHMSYHFIAGGCGIKPFIDLHIIRRKMDYDESVVRKYCKQCGIEVFYNNILHVTDVWFNNGSHTAVSKQIENYILGGGVYGNIENKVAVEQSKNGGKRKFILSRIFMPYESLKKYYLILENHKVLYPIMLVRRWFRVIFCGGLFQVVKEMKLYRRVSSRQVSNMSSFLKDIGL